MTWMLVGAAVALFLRRLVADIRDTIARGLAFRAEVDADIARLSELRRGQREFCGFVEGDGLTETWPSWSADADAALAADRVDAAMQTAMGEAWLSGRPVWASRGEREA